MADDADDCTAQGSYYYWDDDSQTCEYDNNQECIDNYGENYYYDGETCQPDNNEEQECNDLGGYNYWDAENQTCEYDSEQECNDQGSYYYWDTENQTCEYDYEQECNAQGPYSYWNGTTCEYDYEQECNDQDGYWDGTECKDKSFWCETEYGSNYYWDGANCVEHSCDYGYEYDSAYGECIPQCSENYYYDGSRCVDNITGCPQYSSDLSFDIDGAYHNTSDGLLDYIEMPSTRFDFNNNGTIDSNECYVARINIQDGTYLQEHSLSSDEVVQNAGISVSFCKYNPNTGNYDLSCTYKVSVCTIDETRNNLFSSSNSLLQTVGGWLDFTQSDLAHFDSMFIYRPYDNATYDRCHGTGLSFACPAHSTTDPIGPVGESYGQWFDFNGDGEQTLDECVASMGYSNWRAWTDSVTEHENYENWVHIYKYLGDNKDEPLNKNAIGASAFCRYNTQTGNYDLSCTQAVNLCDVNELIYLESLQPSTINTLNYFIDLVEDYYQQTIPQSYYASMFNLSANSITLLDRCSRPDAVCPVHSASFENGPIAEMAGYGVDFNDNGEITLDECIAGRVYGSIGVDSLPIIVEQLQFSNFETLYNLATAQNTFDGENTLNQETALSIAFCKYDTTTGNYDGNCTPAISAFCSMDDIYGLNGTNFQTRTTFPYMLSMAENYTGNTIPKSMYSNIFTDSAAAISYLNICPACPFGSHDDFPGDCAMHDYQSCSVGQYLYVDAENEIAECKICEKGYYCPYGQDYDIVSGTQGIEQCPQDTVSIAGATTYEQCEACETGYHIEDFACTPNVISVIWDNIDPEYAGQNNENTITYGSDINTPFKALHQKGKNFIGWMFQYDQ